MSKIQRHTIFFRMTLGPFAPGRQGEGLPEAYQKFWREWRVQKPQPVHFIPQQGNWKRNPETGEVTPVQNIPIPLKFPKESHNHLWGGEGVVMGFQKRKSFRRRVPHFWVPTLHETVVHSEILNKHMSVVVTDRTMDLIHKHYGFDNYILQTPACDLQSELALKIKRRLLTTLLKNDLDYEDEKKKEEVYEKYKKYVQNYTEEEIEWYGLNLREAVAKYRKSESEKIQVKPLKYQYRLDLINELLEKGLAENEDIVDPQQSKSTWLSKINPFGRKKS